MLSYEIDIKILSLFLQQVKRLKENEQEENKGIKDEANRIRLHPKGKKETLRRRKHEI